MMEPDEISEIIGERLAEGYGDFEIVAYLQSDQGLSEADAIKALRSVYDTWQDIGTRLAIIEQDTRNWHTRLRMQILRTALSQETVSGGTLALRILDSLAALQGLQPEFHLPSVPLEIHLIEKKKDNDAKGKDATEPDPGEPGGT